MRVFSYVGARKLFTNATNGGTKAKASSVVYRDELDKLPSSKEKQKKHGLATKGETFLSSAGEHTKKFEGIGSSSVPGEEQKGVVRVKVMMTKQEAARLLSKCSESGRIGFQDLANELVQIPTCHARFVSSTTGRKYCSTLKCIPEEI